MSGGLRKRLARADWGRGTLAGLAALSLGAPAAQAQLAVDEVAIAAGLASEVSGPGWFFVMEVQGASLVSGAVTPPVGGGFVLADASGAGLELEFEAGPFATFAALQAAHPPGNYTLVVNGSHTVTLGWSPIEPLGTVGEPSLVIDTPANGATGVGSMPDVAFTLDCTNCNDLNLELESLPGPTFGFGQLDVGTFLNPIPFSAMELRSSGAETELPDVLVDAELLVGLVDFTDESFDPPSSLEPFEYVEAAVVTTVSTFTVPEPGGPATVVPVLATLGLLARRGRRSARR
jgi:hypothetical protein